ncbi:MAG: hypothetical protein WCI79_01275 [Candidatus Saccharibacteria bacterium]
MSVAAEVLVIILSVALAFFLVLGIILVVYLIKITRQIRRVTNSAERTVNNVESVVASAGKLISPVVIANMINKVINKFKKSTNKKEEK